MTDSLARSGTGKISLLYVDDEADLLLLGKMFLERIGEFIVDTLPSAEEALHNLEIRSYDAIVSDYQMPGMDGIEFLKAVRKNQDDIPFILFTGRGREEVVIEAINNGVDFYLQKGTDTRSQYLELSHKVLQAVRRKRAEGSLKESEAHSFDFISSLSDPAFAINNSGQIVAWNHAMEEMSNASASDLLGKDCHDSFLLLFGYHRPLFLDLIDKPSGTIAHYFPYFYKAGDTYIAETQISPMKTEPVWMQLSAYHLYNYAGEVIGTVESIKDITEIRETQWRLKESEAMYRTLVENSHNAVLITRFDGSIRYMNPAAFSLLEEDPASLSQKNLFEYIHPDSRRDLAWDIAQAKLGIETAVAEYKFVSSKNREIYTESLGKKIPYQNAEAIQFIIRDVTEKWQIHEILRNREEKFRALTEQSPDIIMRVNRDLTLLYCNPALAAHVGIPMNNLVGRGVDNCFGAHEGLFLPWKGLVQGVFHTGLAARDRLEYGLHRWFDVLCYPEFGADQSVLTVTTYFKDISLQKQAEVERERYYQDLIIQQEFSSALLDAIQIPIFWKDRNQQILGCNQAFSTRIGRSPEEIAGRSLFHLCDTNLVEEMLQHDQELIDSGSLPPYPGKITTHDGVCRDLIISKSLFHDNQGNVRGIVTSFQDISEYNHLIRSLRHTEEFFRMVLNQSMDFFLVLTPEMDVSFISPSIEPLSGYLCEEILGPAERYIHPDDYSSLVLQIKRLTANPSSSESAEFRSRKRDGSYMLLKGVAINCIDNPAVQGILVTLDDITSKRQVERDLSRINRLFSTIINSSSFSFAILSGDGMVVYENQAFRAQIQGSPDSLSIFDFFSPEWRENWEEISTQIINTRIGYLHEFEQERHGSPSLLSTYFFPIPDDDDLKIGFFCLDVTEKRMLLHQLQETITQNSHLAEIAERRTEEISHLLSLKNSLIEAIAHELRTPLTPISVLVPLLNADECSASRSEIIQVIERNAAKIKNIVDKILLLAKLGVVCTVEETEKVCVQKIVESVLQVYSVSADMNGATLHNEVPADIFLTTSPVHLYTILDNLISNAVKFSRDGGMIRVSGEKKGEEISLHVIDEGIGMSNKELRCVFEPFYKGDTSRHDRSSPGLGLPLARQLVLAIGGKLSLRSEGPGKGTDAHLLLRDIR